MHGSTSSDTQRRLDTVRVLGPVDVVVDGRTVALSSRLERVLLAALAVSTNRAVTTDQLADILWVGEPPPSRDNTLQTHVSRLRHLIGHAAIVSEERSYTLAVDLDQLDAVRFEHLAKAAAAQRADPETCLALCREALALWRGTPFGELADDDPFRLEAIRLEQIRLFVVELRLGSEIAIGLEEIAAGALEALVEEYPLREHLWHLLIAALALSGRRTEALRAYERLRLILRDVGLDPGAPTRELVAGILAESADIRSDLLTSLV
jgi:DNA-binding SARP family transcriptional activator